MIPSPIFRSLRLTALAVGIATTVASFTGCTTMERAISGVTNVAGIRAQEMSQLSRIRQETRDELADQREALRRVEAERAVQQARLEAERRRLEMEFCRANQEALQRQVRSNVRDTLESRVAFNVMHGLEVGELEVDQEALEKLLEARKKEPYTAPPREPYTGRPREALTGGGCSCCDQPCGCAPGMIRRHCPRCRHRGCEAEQDCGGREALTHLEREPYRQPLRPTEIPLKLPVRLTFGMQQPEMEDARIRREPLISEPFRHVPHCDRPGCDHANCPFPQRSGAAPARPPLPPARPSTPPASADARPPMPPTPVADPTAYRAPGQRHSVHPDGRPEPQSSASDIVWQFYR